VLAGIALAVRAAHFFAMRDSTIYDVLICDAWGYDQWARRIAAGDWLGNEVFYQTPLYPYLIGVVYSIAGPSVWAVRVVQAMFGAAACVMLAQAGNRYLSRPVGWLAGLILAVYPPAIFFDGILQKASLDLLLMASLLWATSALELRVRTGVVIVCGLIGGLLTLNRENAVVLLPLVLAWVVARAWNETAWVRLRHALVYLGSIAAVLVPVGLRNQCVGGTFLLTTSQMGSNFYIGNHSGASGCYEPLRPGRGDPRHESQDARLLAEQASGRTLSPSEISNYWMTRSWHDISADPASWLRLVAWKWLLTWNTVELVDGEGLRVHAQESPILNGLSWLMHFGIICPLAVLGIWWTRHDWRRLWLLYAMLASLAAAVTLFYVFARYRYPLVPVVALFASAGGTILWQRLRGTDPTVEGEKLPWLVPGLLAVVVALACNWPLWAYYEDHVTYFNVGTALLDANRPAEAIGPLERAAELDPMSAATFNNLGRAALAAGKADDAGRYFGRALKLDAGLAAAWYGAGEVAEKRGDTVQAAACYQKAAELDVHLALARRALGRLELSRGRFPEAITHLQAVVAIEPQAAVARTELAAALAGQSDLRGAIEQLRAALAIDPNSPAANDLAWILATAPDDAVRDGAAAVKLAEQACRLPEHQTPERLDTLAAAYAEAGRIDPARSTLERALALAKRANQAELVKDLEARQRLYAEGKPYRDPALHGPAGKP